MFQSPQTFICIASWRFSTAMAVFHPVPTLNWNLALVFHIPSGSRTWQWKIPWEIPLQNRGFNGTIIYRFSIAIFIIFAGG
jgi:hypothetical protein